MNSWLHTYWMLDNSRFNVHINCWFWICARYFRPKKTMRHIQMNRLYYGAVMFENSETLSYHRILHFLCRQWFEKLFWHFSLVAFYYIKKIRERTLDFWLFFHNFFALSIQIEITVRFSIETKKKKNIDQALCGLLWFGYFHFRDVGIVSMFLK